MFSLALGSKRRTLIRCPFSSNLFFKKFHEFIIFCALLELYTNLTILTILTNLNYFKGKSHVPNRANCLYKYRCYNICMYIYHTACIDEVFQQFELK